MAQCYPSYPYIPGVHILVDVSTYDKAWWKSIQITPHNKETLIYTSFISMMTVAFCALAGKGYSWYWANFPKQNQIIVFEKTNFSKNNAKKLLAEEREWYKKYGYDHPGVLRLVVL